MSADIGKPFERLGGVLIDPAISLPAALPLDLCGESVRARLCMFTDHKNQDLALRPDLTLSVALNEIEQRESGLVQGEHVQRYKARAFRQPAAPDEPLEFYQIGFERFDASITAGVDAQTYALVSETAVDAGVREGVAGFGDLSLLPGFIDVLDLSDATKAGLRRAFREEGGVRAFLDRSETKESSFLMALSGLDRAAVERRVADRFAQDGISHFADRTSAEVITRLLEQARDVKNGAVPDLARETLDAVLNLQCAPADAASKLREIAVKAKIETETSNMLDQLEDRHNQIKALAPQFLDGAQFSPSFGRRFTYYDGFVFEISQRGDGQSRPFGAGGRYDRLLADLSQGRIRASAIGGVVRPDRLMLAQVGEAHP